MSRCAFAGELLGAFCLSGLLSCVFGYVLHSLEASPVAMMRQVLSLLGQRHLRTELLCMLTGQLDIHHGTGTKCEQTVNSQCQARSRLHQRRGLPEVRAAGNPHLNSSNQPKQKITPARRCKMRTMR